VRHGKAALSSGCKSHPATAPAGIDLTTAEARVARSLASGKTVEDIASDGGTLNTIRTHVRGVLEKTGCNRQVDIVALPPDVTPRLSGHLAKK
jgi:DNA-binding CsgD family transcriptional regulator